ncbi:20S-pre-rRNA D-site endonuclease nob1 [Rhodotorula kratochvilovae]
MASKPPQPTMSWVGARAIKHLVVDTGPLVTAPVSSLRNTATHYLVTPDVVAELRDRKGRNVIDEAKLQLPADTVVEGQEPDELHRSREGFEVREPTPEAVARITSFARKTGDLAVLSSADIRVLALCLTLELEENGTWRVREFPGQQLTGPPKEEKKDGGAEGEKGEKDGEGKGKGKEGEGPAPAQEDAADALVEKVEELKVDEPKEEEVPAASTSSAPTDSPAPESSPAPSADSPASAADSPTPTPAAESAKAQEEQDDDEEDVSDAESDSSAGSWITPDNVHDHQVRDLGLFESADAAAASTSGGAQASTSSAPAPPPKPKTIMKAAVLTGDFAMQNVALQMGLNVLGSGGKRVREVRTWVLRCHACFKLCKNPDKRFCPSCGGATLLRTSITYVPVSPQHPQGYILHLKSNFNYRLRGTQFSMANPKMGKAGGNQAEMVVREDQKEWVRGVRSAEIRREKEQRALQKAVLDDEKRGKRSSPAGSAGWFAEAGSLEAQMLGIGGSKGGVDGMKGRRRGGKNGAGGEVRLDKMGLPIIGNGRRNVNEARRRK